MSLKTATKVDTNRVELEIEVDATPVDGNWFQKEEYKLC